MKVEKPPLLVRETDYLSESDRSELSDIQEEAEEELSEFSNASLPGLSDSRSHSSQSGVKGSHRRSRGHHGDDDKKKVQETLQVSLSLGNFKRSQLCLC